jgi:osmotically-inducible protein OsmY
MSQRRTGGPGRPLQPRYSSEPVRNQGHWQQGFYTGEDREHRAQIYAERPHGVGGFESNYGTARSELRRVDTPAFENPLESPVRERHRGKGPKGYARSDARVRELICEALTQHPRIDASDVEVNVGNGEVSLSGSVVDRWTKFAIEELAERYVEADRIHNAVKVSRRNDAMGWTDEEWPIGS